MSTENNEEQFVDDVQGEGAANPSGGEPTSVVPSSQDKLEEGFRQLAAEIKSAVAPKAEPAAQLTPEQEKELWAIYDPESTRKDFMHKFFKLNPDATPEEVKDAKDLWSDMQKGLVRQAVVGSRNLFQAELAKMRKDLEDRYSPLEAHFQEARAAKLQTDFYSSYPALGVKNEAGGYQFQTAIRMAATDLAKATFPDQSTYFKALAERATEIIKGILPTFDLGAAKTNRKTASTPSLPRTRVGGSGGTSAEGAIPVLRGANGDDASTLDWG